MAARTLSRHTDSFFMTVNEEKLDAEGQELDRITLVNGGSEEEGRCFICKVCHGHLRENNMPPKAAANCLEATAVPDDVRLGSYLEEALLARTLLFMKIFSLKSSLMPAVKDKCVVIPIEHADVLNTVQSLPRLPSESGIIDIQWKRRVGQKNAHLQAKVEPEKIFRALEFLKACGNKHYIAADTEEEYKTRCLAEDPEGYELLFGPTESDVLLTGVKVDMVPDSAAERIMELPQYLELREDQVTGEGRRSKHCCWCKVFTFPIMSLTTSLRLGAGAGVQGEGRGAEVSDGLRPEHLHGAEISRGDADNGCYRPSGRHRKGAG